MLEKQKIFISPKTDISDKDIYEYLLHIGALLCAVERGKSTFEKAGYLRSSTAEIISKAKPEKMSFSAKIAMISEKKIIVSLEI